MMEIDVRNIWSLLIPDTHIPYHHKDAIKFLVAVRKEFIGKKPYKVFHGGDEIDHASISFHEKDPDMPFSPSSELERSIEVIQEFKKEFNEVNLLESNHGSLIFRRAKYAGIPVRTIVPLQKLLNTPNWNWHNEIMLKTVKGNIYLCHGKTSSNGNLVKEMGCYGSIQFHFHGKFQIMWQATATGVRFDAFSGCLIDVKSMAFDYGKNNIPKPILGCTLITPQGTPRLIRMNTDKNGRWDGELS